MKKGRTFPSSQRAEKKKCRTCGNEFRAIGDHTGTKGGLMKRTPQIYCSHSCYVKGNRVSMFEDSVYGFLVNHCTTLTRQVRKLNWTFDMSIPGTNILIEADGSYWHSKQNAKERDQRKNRWCSLNGFELYRIDELGFYKNKQAACQVILDRMARLDPALEVLRNGTKMALKSKVENTNTVSETVQ